MCIHEHINAYIIYAHPYTFKHNVDSNIAGSPTHFPKKDSLIESSQARKEILTKDSGGYLGKSMAEVGEVQKGPWWDGSSSWWPGHHPFQEGVEY